MDSNKFILNSFQNMFKSDAIKQSSAKFSVVKIELDEVTSLLKDVDSNASPGISGLPIVILKQRSSSIFEPSKQILIAVSWLY